MHNLTVSSSCAPFSASSVLNLSNQCTVLVDEKAEFQTAKSIKADANKTNRPKPTTTITQAGAAAAREPLSSSTLSSLPASATQIYDTDSIGGTNQQAESSGAGVIGGGSGSGGKFCIEFYENFSLKSFWCLALLNERSINKLKNW